jgi:hypothetical protein
MERVFTQADRDLSHVPFAAIAIRSVTAEQRHIGVLYRESDADGICLLHLAWHHQLRNERPGGDYLWVEVAAPRRRLRNVSAICRRILRAAAQGQQIPYAFSQPNDCFDSETGQFLLGPNRLGLTCASFVLAVFETAGLRLAQYETWPHDREGDRAWQAWIVQQLQTGPNRASDEHVAAVRSQLGNARFRPEEVAVAATVDPLPADFNVVLPRAEQLLKRLLSRRF